MHALRLLRAVWGADSGSLLIQADPTANSGSGTGGAKVLQAAIMELL